jgi:hypothetical protein
MGETMRFSDWERSLGTLAAIVGAWADVGGAGAPDALEKGLVARVFLAPPKVETAPRPQDLACARGARDCRRPRAAGKAPVPVDRALALASDEARRRPRRPSG